MTLTELQTIKVALALKELSTPTTLKIHEEALQLIEREINLRTMDPRKTGEADDRSTGA